MVRQRVAGHGQTKWGHTADPAAVDQPRRNDDGNRRGNTVNKIGGVHDDQRRQQKLLFLKTVKGRSGDRADRQGRHREHAGDHAHHRGRGSKGVGVFRDQGVHHLLWFWFSPQPSLLTFSGSFSFLSSTSKCSGRTRQGSVKNGRRIPSASDFRRKPEGCPRRPRRTDILFQSRHGGSRRPPPPKASPESQSFPLRCPWSLKA